MLKVALVSPFTLPEYHGNSILVDRLHKGLAQREYEVRLFNSHKDTPEQAIEFSPQIIHSFNAERTFLWMEKFHTKFSAPWVITLTGTDYTPWCGIKAPPQNIKESLERAGALIVFHEPAGVSLSAVLPLLKNKISVIPQGVSPLEGGANRNTVRAKYNIKQEAIVFLIVAGIRPIKNIPLAIRAFSEVKKHVPEVVLLHVGPIMDKGEADQIFALSKDLSFFRSLGELPPQEVREIIRASDALVNTSFQEGMSGAILEAMAEGLPILASSADGNLALVHEDKNGFIFSVDDPDKLTQRAIEFARDPSVRKKMGEESKSLARKNYSEKKELDLHEQVYRRLAP